MAGIIIGGLIGGYSIWVIWMKYKKIKGGIYCGGCCGDCKNCEKR